MSDQYAINGRIGEIELLHPSEDLLCRDPTVNEHSRMTITDVGAVPLGSRCEDSNLEGTREEGRQGHIRL